MKISKVQIISKKVAKKYKGSDFAYKRKFLQWFKADLPTAEGDAYLLDAEAFNIAKFLNEFLMKATLELKELRIFIKNETTTEQQRNLSAFGQMMENPSQKERKKKEIKGVKTDV